MQGCAMGFEDIATADGTVQLAPGTAIGMAIGPDIPATYPATIVTVGGGAEVRRRVHLARAATRGDDTGWWGAGRLGARHSCLRTGLAVGLMGEARKGLRDPRALAGWWHALGWPRDACGVTAGPGSMQHAAQPEKTQQHQLVEKEVGYHRVAPFHGGETGALYPFCRLLNYPHDRGTRPQYLGAQPGLLAALHTWSQTLVLHPHVHCLVTGGGLTPDGHWKA